MRSRKYHAKLMDDLQDPAEAAAYLDAALEAGDREAFLLALKHVAEACGGMSRLAKTAADGPADLSLSFDSQAAAIGIGGTIGAIGTAGAVRIAVQVGRKPRPVPAVGVTG